MEAAVVHLGSPLGLLERKEDIHGTDCLRFGSAVVQ